MKLHLNDEEAIIRPIFNEERLQNGKEKKAVLPVLSASCFRQQEAL